MIMNPVHELTTEDLTYIDKCISLQISSKIEIVPDDKSSFTIDPIKLKDGLTVEADITVSHHSFDKHNYEYSSEDRCVYAELYPEFIELVEVDAMLVDKDGDGYIIPE
ncbi:MAG: hypothetical protein EOM11_09455, partial [Erysipelotrichia bacterium]|nr:hypothetical protein [Erysipelotrichia bacterium]